MKNVKKTFLRPWHELRPWRKKLATTTLLKPCLPRAGRRRSRAVSRQTCSGMPRKFTPTWILSILWRRKKLRRIILGLWYGDSRMSSPSRSFARKSLETDRTRRVARVATLATWFLKIRRWPFTTWLRWRSKTGRYTTDMKFPLPIIVGCRHSNIGWRTLLRWMKIWILLIASLFWQQKVSTIIWCEFGAQHRNQSSQFCRCRLRRLSRMTTMKNGNLLLLPVLCRTERLSRRLVGRVRSAPNPAWRRWKELLPVPVLPHQASVANLVVWRLLRLVTLLPYSKSVRPRRVSRFLFLSRRNLIRRRRNSTRGDVALCLITPFLATVKVGTGGTVRWWGRLWTTSARVYSTPSIVRTQPTKMRLIISRAKTVLCIRFFRRCWRNQVQWIFCAITLILQLRSLATPNPCTLIYAIILMAVLLPESHPRSSKGS